jgi:uncharacterized membrane protein YccF (DUF307 family)
MAEKYIIMNTLGNIIWLLFGGFFIALEYLLTSILLAITIIGIPFAIQILKLASFALWPFGKEVVVKEDKSSFTPLFNLLWLIFGGIIICLSHFLMGLIFFITIIGIPFGKQHFKLAGLALTPFGREIKDKI